MLSKNHNAYLINAEKYDEKVLEKHVDYIYSTLRITDDTRFSVTIFFVESVESLVSAMQALQYSVNTIREYLLDMHVLHDVTLSDCSTAYCLIEQN